MKTVVPYVLTMGTVLLDNGVGVFMQTIVGPSLNEFIPILSKAMYGQDVGQVRLMQGPFVVNRAPGSAATRMKHVLGSTRRIVTRPMLRSSTYSRSFGDTYF